MLSWAYTPLCAAAFLCFGAALLVGPKAAQIHDAARFGDSAELAAQIAAGSSLEALDTGGDTPLIAAAIEGEGAAVRQLLAAGAQIDGRSDRGLTALHAAAYRGHLEIVRLLVEQGAKIDDQQNKFRITPLHAAAEEGHGEVVAYLISQGASVDLKEANAITPLSRAGWREHWDVFEMLRRAGATCQPASFVGEELFERCMATDP